MDETDLRIILRLMENCRTPQREIANLLDMSVTAVNKRLNALEGHVIADYIAGLHFAVVKAHVVLIYGTSETPLNEETCDRIGRHPLVSRVSIASGNMVYVTGWLEQIEQLDELSLFVENEANIDEVTVGIVNHFIPKHFSSSLDGGKLATMDYRIIRALRKGARKGVAEVADELATSTKTVRRRLQKLIETNSLKLSVDLDCSGELFTMMHIHLEKGAEKSKLVHRIINGYRPHAFEIATMTNMSRDMFVQAWASNMQEMNSIQSRLGEEVGIVSVVPNIFISGTSYPTWRDELVDSRCGN